MKKRLVAILMIISVMSGVAKSQCVWTSAELKTQIVKNLSGYVEGQFRTHDGLTHAERWAGTIGLEYGICKYLKVTAAYAYIHQQSKESKSADSFTPSYWTPKHRGLVAFTGSYSWGGFTFSLRERYQDTYNREQYVSKYEIDGVTPKGEKYIEAKHKHTLRSRLQVGYKFSDFPLSPYASCELHNFLADKMKLEETRWTAGLTYNINKRNSIELYYRFIDETEKDDMHIIGIGYKIKL